MKGYLDSRKWLATGSWASVNSKTVKGIRYDRKSRRLFIESSKGVVMSYEGVHPMTARACFNSKLIPKFVAKRLLRKYLCSRHNLSPMEKAMDWRDRVRKLQDRLLALPSTRTYVQNYGENKPLWEGGPSASQLRSMLYQNWETYMEGLISELGGRR